MERLNYEDVRLGDHYTVLVDGRPYDTVIDPHGVHRFVEDPNNPLRKRLRRYEHTFNPHGDIEDLNAMALLYARHKITQREYLEFNMAIGYSVSGFSGLNVAHDIDIDCPFWDAPDEPDNTNAKTHVFQLTDAAYAVFRGVLETGIEALDEAVYGTKAARAEAKAVVERLISE